MYAITAIINHRTADGWEGSRNLPTFYLDERTQGITSADHAERIARDVVLPFGPTDTMSASVTAVRVPGDDWREPEPTDDADGSDDADADDDGTGIDPEAMARGHRYIMGQVNAYCPKCSEIATEREGRPIIALDCDYDTDK